MLQKILKFLFPKTINNIVNEAIIIKEYGSIKEYNRLMEDRKKALCKISFDKEQEKKKKDLNKHGQNIRIS